MNRYIEHDSISARLLRALSFRNVSALYVLIAMVVVFAIWIPDQYMTSSNLKSILYQSSVTAIIAVGLVVPFSAGAFDASIGGVVGIASIGVAYLMVNSGIPWIPAALIAIAGGAVVGLFNSGLIVWGGVQSVIATLATLSILTGLGAAVADNQIISHFSGSFLEFGSGTFLGIAIPVWVLLVVALTVSYVLDWTALGREMYATGGSEETARLAGVRTKLIVTGALAASGAVAALAGVVATARVGAGQAAIGPPYLLPAFAALFLGATQFKGGRFNVWGAVLATYTLAAGVQGLILAGAPQWLPEVFNGTALALAVLLSVRRSKAVVSGKGRHRRLLARFGRTPDPEKQSQSVGSVEVGQ